MHFHAPWSNTPNSHIITFARQLDCRQIECSDHGVSITEDDKVVHFIQEMYGCGLFEGRFLDNWEEITNKTWKATLPLFTAQFNKEQRTLERQHGAKTHENSNVFRERGADGSFGRSTATNADSDYTAAMEYAAALEDRSNKQEGRVLGLEESLNSHITLTLPTDLAASVAASTTATSTAATKMATMRDMIQSLAASVTTLSSKTLSKGNSGGSKGCNGGGGGNAATQTPGTHKCANCQYWVKHKDANCYKLEANAEKLFPGWVSRLTKK